MPDKPKCEALTWNGYATHRDYPRKGHFHRNPCTKSASRKLRGKKYCVTHYRIELDHLCRQSCKVFK